MKNMFSVLSVVLVAAALSLGAFATVVHAQSFDGGCCGDYGYTGVAEDYGWTGYAADPTDYGYTGIAEDYGWTGYAPDYTDYGYTGYAPDYADYGWTGYAPDDYGYTGYAPDYCNCDTPTYTYDSYSYDSYSPGYSYSVPSVSTPSYKSTTFYAPSYTPSTPTRTTTNQTVATTQPINITNTNNNNNVNNNTNNVNVNVASVSPATTQTQVQYVYPQVQSYPVYVPTYYNGYTGYNYNNYQYQQQPYCTITATTGVNGLVTLYWSSSYATSAYISPSVGSVAPNGSTSLYTYGTTNYTMTVSGQGGSNTCRTNYIAAATPSVSLSQIPYTGFDFGPVGNAIYWMSLLAFAVAGAYLLVYYRGGALAFATQMVGTRTAVSVQEIETPVAASVEEKEESVDVFASLPVMQHAATKDTMSMARTSDGTPRIVINRG